MGLTKQGRYVYCYECGSRQEMNGVCRICGHVDVPPLAGMLPNVVGLTQIEATALLTDPEAQLNLGNVTTDNSETVPVDAIISTEPAAGTQLTIGAPVHIVVSLGPAA